jgi:hypothetical protein
MSEEPSEQGFRFVSIDQIDGDVAILVDDRHRASVPVSWLPAGSTQGTVLRLVLTPDPEEQARLEAHIKKLQARARRGDIEL